MPYLISIKTLVVAGKYAYPAAAAQVMTCHPACKRTGSSRVNTMN
jgi:hypothetical protein